MAMVQNEIELIDYNGIQIFNSDIDILCDEYINSLSNPDMIYKPMCYTGMLEYIYKRLLKNILDKSKTGNNNDYDLLNNVFYEIYLPLCYKYLITPSVLGFTVFCHLSNENISDIRNGVYRSNGSKVNIKHNQIVKNWYTVCESGLYNKAVESNGIGAIFILKSKYGYQEQQTINVNSDSMITHESAEQIAARHSAAQLPEKIDL